MHGRTACNAPLGNWPSMVVGGDGMTGVSSEIGRLGAIAAAAVCMAVELPLDDATWVVNAIIRLNAICINASVFLTAASSPMSLDKFVIAA